MAILLPFNIVLACVDFYELKVSNSYSGTSTWYSIWTLYHRKFLLNNSHHPTFVDAWLFSCEYLPVCSSILTVLRFTVLHSVWGSIYPYWSINNLGICNSGRLIDFRAYFCKYRRLYGLLGRILYSNDRWLVCRSRSRLLLSRECKATWQLHWYFLDESRIGWHLQQRSKIYYSRNLERQSVYLSVSMLSNCGDCVRYMHPRLAQD